jgi:hypothetical protein
MNVDDMLRQMQIDLLVALIQHNKEQIEPRHDRRTHRDVRPQTHLPVVPPPYRVRRRQDGRSRVEGRLDARFGDGDRLLLHGFVNGDLVGDVHLVELVDSADTVVGEHECAGFDGELAGFFVLDDGGGETGGGGGFAGSVDGSGEEAADVSRLGERKKEGEGKKRMAEFRQEVERRERGKPNALEKLRFTRTRISDDANVDVSSKMDPLWRLLMNSSEQLQQDSFLDDLVT